MAWLIVLGLVQGLTEFLPVSSSAHLAILHHLVPGDSLTTNVAFDILLHLATLAAVLVYFRADLLRLATGLVRRDGQPDDCGLSPLMTLAALAVATLGTGLMYGLYKALGIATKEDTQFSCRSAPASWSPAPCCGASGSGPWRRGRGARSPCSWPSSSVSARGWRSCPASVAAARP